MKISDELKGKEVIDENGDKVGEVSDVEWNPQMNMVESLLVSEGAAAKIGVGEKKGHSIRGYRHHRRKSSFKTIHASITYKKN